MSVVISNLIFDRSEEDVSRVVNIAEHLTSGTATAAELSEWLSGMKGGYSYRDLNRVGAAMEHLVTKLLQYGYTIPGYIPSPVWKETDVQTPEQMEQYRKNVQAIRDRLKIAASVPNAPADMEGLNYVEANNIERILFEVEDAIIRMEQVFPRSGVYHSNGVIYIPDQSHFWIPVPIPVQVGKVVYTGSIQSPDWGVDMSVFSVTGGSGTDAGDYVASIKPLEGYKWPDGSTAAKSFPWSIEKAVPTLEFPDTLTMSKENWQDALQISYDGDGDLSIAVDNKNLYAALNGLTVTVMSVAIGDSLITVSATEGKNYKAATSATCMVTILDIIRTEPPVGIFQSGATMYYSDKYR